MPSVNNQGVRIHYDIEGEGPPLVIQPGFSDSSATWYELGYVEALKQDYRLILVDARGHGASDKPHDPVAYDFQCYATDIIAVLDAPGISTAHFFGYSMGGRIGFALAKYAPARFSSLIIGGSHPYQGPLAARDPWIATLKQGPKAIATLWDAPVSPTLRVRLEANDIEALIAMRTQRKESSRLAEVLPAMTMPCLLIGGEEDPGYPRIKECATYMPNVTFVSLPGLTHAGTLFRSDLVLPHVMKFLAAL